MKQKYSHLSAEERDHLAVLRGKGYSLRDIANILGRDPSSLSRELHRNAPPIRHGYYLGHRAHLRYQTRNRERARRKRLKTNRIRAYVTRQIRRGWSPERIAGRLAHLWPLEHVSHETIYQWIRDEANHLLPFLLRAKKNRRQRGYSRKHVKSHIPGRVSIEQRPQRVEARQEFGHWEADTAVSRESKAALQVVVERKSRMSKIKKLDRKTARAMRIALNRTLVQFPKGMRKTLTYDNGSENAEHLTVNTVLGTKSYFCAPFHSWQRGTCENTVGLVRRRLPKKTDFAIVSDKKIKTIERWLNNMPRKCLGFQTPAEVFRQGVALTG